jgi:SAM-dependent methyltransferase
MERLIAFALSVTFAVGLGVSGLVRPEVITGAVDVGGAFNPSLYLSFAAALALYMPLWRLARRRHPERCALPKRAIDARLVAGSIIFGVGWGLAGTCPGPAVVWLASASSHALTFALAMLTGMAPLHPLATSNATTSPNPGEQPMAAQCPVGFDVPKLRQLVRATYDRVAREPQGDFHFHRGPRYAAEYLGYDAAELALLPEEATARFAGVGNPIAVGPITAGETVLDHACGAGMDLLLAARRVGSSGKAIGVDMTPAMRRAATRAAAMADLAHVVEVRGGLFEELPVEDASVDVVISNGVVNLSPHKDRVFGEIARVLRPGGRLNLADVVVQRELKLEARIQPELWAACIGGALPEPELHAVAAAAGLAEGRITARFDCFANTSAEAKLSKDLRVSAVSFFARKPG